MTPRKPKAASDRAGAMPASPVCYADEMGPTYGGYFTDAELAALLAELMSAARARDRTAIAGKLKEALPRVRDDRIHAALKIMLDAPEAEVAVCKALIAKLR